MVYTGAYRVLGSVSWSPMEQDISQWKYTYGISLAASCLGPSESFKYPPVFFPQLSSLMKYQQSNERKSESQPPLSRLALHARQLFRVNTQRMANRFNKPSFFQFKLKPGFLHCSPSNSHSSLADDASHSTQSLSTISSNVSVHTSASVPDQAVDQDVASNKSSKLRRTLDAVSSKVQVPIARTATIHSICSAPLQATLDYRQPISHMFVTIPIIPGVVRS